VCGQILNLLAAHSPLIYAFCSWGAIDLATCIPVYITVAIDGFSKGSGESFVGILGLLRFARVLKVTRFLREIRLQRMLKTHVTLLWSKLISSAFVVSAIWLLFASLIYVVEVEIPVYRHKSRIDDLARLRGEDNRSPETDSAIGQLIGKLNEFVQPDLTFGKCLYFSMVTFSTVGFGEITPKTPLGQWVVVSMIVLGLAFIAQRIAQVGEILGSMSKVRGKRRRREEEEDGGPPAGDVSFFGVFLVFVCVCFFPPSLFLQRGKILCRCNFCSHVHPFRPKNTKQQNKTKHPPAPFLPLPSFSVPPYLLVSWLLFPPPSQCF
jgi:voltage-gated potassium channel Kch